ERRARDAGFGRARDRRDPEGARTLAALSIRETARGMANRFDGRRPGRNSDRALRRGRGRSAGDPPTGCRDRPRFRFRDSLLLRAPVRVEAQGKTGAAGGYGLFGSGFEAQVLKKRAVSRKPLAVSRSYESRLTAHGSRSS